MLFGTTVEVSHIPKSTPKTPVNDLLQELHGKKGINAYLIPAYKIYS